MPPSHSGPPSFPALYRVRVLDVDGLRDPALLAPWSHLPRDRVVDLSLGSRIVPLYVSHLPIESAPAVRKEMMEVGGDAVPIRVPSQDSDHTTAMLLLGTLGQYRNVVPRWRDLPLNVASLADAVEISLHHHTSSEPRVVKGVHRSFTVGAGTRVMGIVNVTPDSFYDGGRYSEPAQAVGHARRLVLEGADVLDIGGESTRPGATPVSEEEEWARVGPVLSALHSEFSIPLSIDTRHPGVAARAIDAGADIINDVEGLRRPEMRRVLRETGAAAVVMHMRGDPESMQSDLHYRDLREEVFGFLDDATRQAVREGVARDQLLIDPGLGFGKSAEQSMELLRHLREFRSLGFPVVVGPSRKSFLGWALSGAPVEERSDAGIAAAVLAAEHGADVIRVHDVLATVRALRFTDALGRRGSLWPGGPV